MTDEILIRIFGFIGLMVLLHTIFQSIRNRLARKKMKQERETDFAEFKRKKKERYNQVMESLNDLGDDPIKTSPNVEIYPAGVRQMVKNLHEMDDGSANTRTDWETLFKSDPSYHSIEIKLRNVTHKKKE